MIFGSRAVGGSRYGLSIEAPANRAGGQRPSGEQQRPSHGVISRGQTPADTLRGFLLLGYNVGYYGSMPWLRDLFLPSRKTLV